MGVVYLYPRVYCTEEIVSIVILKEVAVYAHSQISAGLPCVLLFNHCSLYRPHRIGSFESNDIVHAITTALTV